MGISPDILVPPIALKSVFKNLWAAIVWNIYCRYQSCESRRLGIMGFLRHLNSSKGGTSFLFLVQNFHSHECRCLWLVVVTVVKSLLVFPEQFLIKAYYFLCSCLCFVDFLIFLQVFSFIPTPGKTFDRKQNVCI